MMYSLWAFGVKESVALLCHFCDGAHENVEPGVSAWEQEIEEHGSHPDDLNLNMNPDYPKEPGFWMWVGARQFTSGPDPDREWYGTWSRAGTGEVVRFMSGCSASSVFAYRF